MIDNGNGIFHAILVDEVESGKLNQLTYSSYTEAPEICLLVNDAVFGSGTTGISAIATNATIPSYVHHRCCVALAAFGADSCEQEQGSATWPFKLAPVCSELFDESTVVVVSIYHVFSCCRCR